MTIEPYWSPTVCKYFKDFFNEAVDEQFTDEYCFAKCGLDRKIWCITKSEPKRQLGIQKDVR